MKKIMMIIAMLTMTLAAMAQAEITFDKTTHDFGTFTESNGIQKCVFKFKNTGDKDLVISTAIATCGCTAPTYTKTPVKPGETGTINVRYNGIGKPTGVFKKTITVRSNAKNDVVRLYITGTMNE